MHYSTRTEIRALRQPWVRNTIALYVCKIDTRDGRTVEAIAEPLAFHALTADEELVEPAPTLRLTPGEAQQLIDQLWRTGIRPTEGAGSVGQLQATERHLEDMRTLVFKPTRRSATTENVNEGPTMNTANLLGPHAPETQKVLDGAWAASELASSEPAGPAKVVAAVATGSAPNFFAMKITPKLNIVVSHTGALPDSKISNQVPRPGVGL